MMMDVYTLDEAARAMWTEPRKGLNYPEDSIIEDVCRALAEIVKAIRASDLLTVGLPDDILHRSGRAIMTGEYLDALTNPDYGGAGIVLDSDERERLIASGIERQPLIDFAESQDYPAPTLRGDPTIAGLLTDAAMEGLKVMKGRSKGGRHGARTKQQAVENDHKRVLTLLGAGRTPKEVAELTGYSASQIRRIRKKHASRT